MNKDRLVYHRAALDAATIGIGFLLALLALEALVSGFVSRFFNVHWLLVWVAGASFIAFISHQPSAISNQEKKAGLWLPMFGAVAALYIWTSFPDLRPVTRAIAAGGVLVLSLIASSVLNDE